ncbi:MAG: hypothetical protein GC191_14020 [Azospirillum sp.]|nr:hypothetical protein [Azospirillum sp.]
MSFFKNLKNMVTGGGAELTVSIEEPALEQPFSVHVEAKIGDADCKVKQVYLRLWGEERVEVPNVEVARRNGNELVVTREAVRAATTTVDLTIELAPAGTLQANQTYSWDTEVQVPADALPTYYGRLACHEWRIQAGLDMRGNDPDSGWLTIELY